MQRRHPDINRDLIVLQITGHLFFLGLAVLSVFFWKERQAFDAAHYLFEITDRKFFFIAHHRPAGFVSQILPVIGTWLKLPLSLIAILYSLGDILWYYLIFLFLAYRLETRRGIVALLLMLSLTVRYSFYCPVTELLQAGALLPVWMSLLDRSFRFRFPVLVLIGVFIIFSHPLLFYPLFFALFWWSMQDTRPGIYEISGRSRFIWMMFGTLVIIAGMKMLLLDRYDHDKTFYPVVYNDYGYLNTFSLNVWWHHLQVIATGYPFLSVVLLTALVFLAWFRRWKMAVYLILAVGVFLLIMSLTHRFDHLSNYFERMLLPLPMMVALVAGSMITMTRSFISRLLGFVGLFLILLMHFDLLRMTADPYTARVILLRQLCDAAESRGIKKAIVSEDLLEQNDYAMTGWCYPIETLILSSYEGKDKSVSVALQKEHIEKNRDKGKVCTPSEWIKWAELNLPVSSLNTDYYRLSSVDYLPLLTRDTMTNPSVRLRLTGCTPFKPDKVLLLLQLATDTNLLFPANTTTAVELQDMNGNRLYRTVLPYAFRTQGGWNFTISPASVPDGPLQLVLLHNERRAGMLRIKKDGGHFSETAD